MKVSILRSVYIILTLLLIGVFATAGLHAQQPTLKPEAKFKIEGRADRRVAIPFKLVNNLVIIELQINGSQPLRFILDSGVGSMLITELPNNEEVVLNHTSTVRLAGLGIDEPMEAYRSVNNEVKLAGLIGNDIEVLFLKERTFNLSAFMGMFVHGLIGYDMFSSFAVEVDYGKKVLFLYDPHHFEKKFRKLARHRKWHKFPITFINRKPYLDVQFRNSPADTLSSLKLLIDSGASNAFSFYETSKDEIRIPETTIPTLLGVGLSGVVPGVMGRIHEVRLNDLVFSEPVIAFPDSAAVSRAIMISDRNGSLGAEVLKRFKVIFHYQDSSIFLRKNSDYGKEFTYNTSGIEITTPVPNLPLYVIYSVRGGSPAGRAGLQQGDILDRINGKRVESIPFNEIISLLEARRRVQLVVQRENGYMTVKLDLRNELE